MLTFKKARANQVMLIFQVLIHIILPSVKLDAVSQPQFINHLLEVQLIAGVLKRPGDKQFVSWALCQFSALKACSKSIGPFL